jgi:hypothetical protein
MSEPLDQAITAIKTGDRDTGRLLLTRLTEAEPANEKAWLWLTQTTDSPTDRIIYLQHVLEINPNNVVAQQGLARLLAGDATHPTQIPVSAWQANPPPNQIRLAMLIFLALGVPGCIVLGIAGYLLSYALNYDLSQWLQYVR